MKWVVIAAMMLMVVCGPASGATLNLKATWTPPTTNADGTRLREVASYKLYRTDGTKTLISTIQARVPLIISQSPALINLPVF